MRLFFAILFFPIVSNVFGQKAQHLHEQSTQDGLHLTFVISHTFIPETTVEGKSTIAVPSFGFDVEYFFPSRFGVGLHNDLELLIYEVKEDESTFIQREFPVLLTADLLYKLRPDLIIFGGPGIELERERDIPVVRLGLEYMAHIGETLTFSPILSYDYRINAFNSFSVGIGIGFGL